MKIDPEINLNLLQSCESKNPFYHPSFYQALIDSQSIGAQSGWSPVQFTDQNLLSIAYEKTHSYGEYIFDWAWADLYQRAQITYYPKLIHALPFTPVNAPKILGKGNSNHFFKEISNFYLNKSNYHSHHFLFTSQEESHDLAQLGYFIKNTIQYHWRNHQWGNFEDFLSSLKSRKRKQIKKERRTIQESDLEIVKVNFENLSTKDIQEITALYLSTTNKKRSYAYLQPSFFSLLLSNLNNRGFAILAKQQEKIIAMSLFFHSDTTLYGRYWGIYPEFEQEYPFLHFEMCYYRGIDFCLENKFDLFEAGAQGEHKLLRGFMPVKILSAHHLKHPELHEIISNYTKKENFQTMEAIKELKKYSPYKCDDKSLLTT